MATLLKDLTPGEIELVKSYEKANNKKTAELLDMSPSTISKVLGSTRKKRGTVPPFEQLEEARNSGLNNREIAEFFDISVSSVSNAFSKHKCAKEEKPEPLEQDNGKDIVLTGFKKVSIIAYNGKIGEYKIFENGNVRVKFENGFNLSLKQDEVAKMADDLQKIVAFMKSNPYLMLFESR